jgi:glucose-1-phosphate thymidylyltransferase
MAGMGKRLRPHTLTTPKPLLPVAGKPIVQRLVEDIAKVIDEQIEHIAFVVGDFGEDVEQTLMNIASAVGAKGSIHYQQKALGTAHAILCAKEVLTGKVVVAYADTLFKAGFKLDNSNEGAIWVKQVENPDQFGVVKLNNDGSIEGFYEKPITFISDLAIIGIYYFRDGEYLRQELQYLLDKKITTGGEYGITDALQNMMIKGTRFHTETVEAWLDCGNKDATVDTNHKVLAFAMEEMKDDNLISNTAEIEDALIIEPCFIGKGAIITHSVLGPYVSVGDNVVIHQSVVRNSIIQSNAIIENKLIENSMIGKFAQLKGRFDILSLGDYNEIED